MRRKAREGVMRALYQIDLGQCGVEDAFNFAVGESQDLAIAEKVLLLSQKSSAFLFFVSFSSGNCGNKRKL